MRVPLLESTSETRASSLRVPLIESQAEKRSSVLRVPLLERRSRNEGQRTLPEHVVNLEQPVFRRSGPGTKPNRTVRAPDTELRDGDGISNVPEMVLCRKEYQTGPDYIQRLIGVGNEGIELATQSPPEPI